MNQTKMGQARSENPFYGKREMYALWEAVNAGTATEMHINSAKATAKNKQDLELFYSILFMAGDIANREHFGLTKVVTNLDGGGLSNRKQFDIILKWMRKNDNAQYQRFVDRDVIRQYTNIANVFQTGVRTKVGTKTIVGKVDNLENSNIEAVAQYLAWLIQSASEHEKVLLAKYLSLPRFGNRQKRNKEGQLVGKRPLQDQTKVLMEKRTQLYIRVSDLVGWQYERNDKFINFVGLREWKRKYNTELESVLFSTGKIREYDQIQFAKWLDTLPSNALFRTRKRLLTKDNGLKGKWLSKTGHDLGTWFLNWEKSKENAQVEQRVLTEKVRHGTATAEDKVKLQKVEKQAKVNTGARTLLEELEDFLPNPNSSKISIDSVLNKIKFEVPVLTIADCSGSMNESTRTGKFAPYNLARLLVTLAMLKNPSNELDNLLVCFGSECQIYTDGSTGTSQKNKFTTGNTVKVDRLVDRTKTFFENFTTISKFVNSNLGGTHFRSVATKFKEWVNSDGGVYKQQRCEELQKYPVFLVISDGDMNSSHDAKSSMLEFKRVMMELGWDGVVVVWDVNTGMKFTNKYDGIDNVLHLGGWNLSIINQVFTSIHDLDVIDTYLPLKTLHESNRYVLVREAII